MKQFDNNEASIYNLKKWYFIVYRNANYHSDVKTPQNKKLILKILIINKKWYENRRKCSFL